MMSDRNTHEDLSVGIVISARSDWRLLHATLQSIARLASQPALVIVVLPRGREYLVDRPEFAGLQLPIRVLAADALEDSWLAVGFRAMAPIVDLAIFLSEGTIVQRDCVKQVQCRYAAWEDLVGIVDVVADTIKVAPNTENSGLAAGSQMRNGLLHSLLRRRLRARSLMPAVLSVRLAASGNLRFVTFSTFCDWMSYAVCLDQLRARGRTVVGVAEQARELQVSTERRSAFEFGYVLYDRLSRIDDYIDRPVEASYLNPRTEKVKLFVEQALQYLLSPDTRRHAMTTLKGMLKARRDTKMRERAIQRELRDLA